MYWDDHSLQLLNYCETPTVGSYGWKDSL